VVVVVVVVIVRVTWDWVCLVTASEKEPIVLDRWISMKH